MIFRYLDESETFEVSLVRYTAHVVCVISPKLEAKGKGFELSDGNNRWDYSSYKTVYRKVADFIYFSDNGSVYAGDDLTEEESAALAKANTVTADERAMRIAKLQDVKITKMNTVMTALIDEGVEVTLTDGSVEKFTLTANDQLSLMELQSLALTGTVDAIPWHSSNHAEGCKYYSLDDFKLIAAATVPFIIYHVTYFRDLRRYISSLTDEKEIENVSYGMQIPMSYRSEVLKVLMKGGDQK